MKQLKSIRLPVGGEVMEGRFGSGPGSHAGERALVWNGSLFLSPGQTTSLVMFDNEVSGNARTQFFDSQQILIEVQSSLWGTPQGETFLCALPMVQAGVDHVYYEDIHFARVLQSVEGGIYVPATQMSVSLPNGSIGLTWVPAEIIVHGQTGTGGYMETSFILRFTCPRGFRAGSEPTNPQLLSHANSMSPILTWGSNGGALRITRIWIERRVIHD